MNRFLLIAAAIAASSSSAASAALISQTYDFTAGPFTTADNGTAPVQTVTGSLSLTFDDNLTVVDQTGVTVNNLSLNFQTPVLYSYFASNNVLAFRSTNFGFSGGLPNRDVNGFFMTIRNATSIDPLNFNGTFAYSRVGFNDTASTRTLIFGVGNVPGAVPEPATWMMMLMGFGLIGGTMRRKRQVVQITYG